MPRTILPMRDDGTWGCERCQAERNKPGGLCGVCGHWQGFSNDTGCQCVPCTAKAAGQGSLLYDLDNLPF
jgi:hypothetical protein